MPASIRQCRVTGSMSPAAASSAQHLRSCPRPPGPEPLRDVLGGVAKVEVYLRENDHVHFQDGVGPCW